MRARETKVLLASIRDRNGRKIMKTIHWTSKDLEILPDDGQRYEIIDGELYVSRQPHKHHQLVCGRVWELLQSWSRQIDGGEAVIAPGVIFAEDNDVAPDVTWMSQERLATAYQADGKYHAAPDLMVEVLSPGSSNERRDREFKLWLYSRRGVLEYWIISWMDLRLEIYRREEGQLQLHSTLYKNDTVRSPYLPGFTCSVSQFFDDILQKRPEL
jgi:Uma2 family endonuclease